MELEAQGITRFMSILKMVLITIYKPDNSLMLLLEGKTTEQSCLQLEKKKSTIEEIAVQVKEIEE